ncbi:hypothetical protein HYPSUDRAFT_214998 [Hypholoma sublateritium FD-334 SS-4]|uniref:Uncharacterized protein n=1 Tax=Hypholoma sublateritium (strain FD-334 SS-4) TaxID=945553 RepID=A0A0D2L909_HYPSF|nr:hypothetical protein HYPSUDRAFT_214998 [Hypholoma sublateritium FD-334 SS-4]
MYTSWKISRAGPVASALADEARPITRKRWRSGASPEGAEGSPGSGSAARGRVRTARPTSRPRAAERRTEQVAEIPASCAGRRASGRWESGAALRLEPCGTRAGAPPTTRRHLASDAASLHPAFNPRTYVSDQIRGT